MPSMPLVIKKLPFVHRKGQPDEVRFEGGVLPLSAPLAGPQLGRVRYLRTVCNYRVPPISGAREAILDTGAALSLIPRGQWRDDFGWREGVHFEVCDFAGLGPLLDAQLLSHAFRCRIVRLKVPVVVAGSLVDGPRFQIDNLVAQLPETEQPKLTLLGLWGGVFEGRRLVVDRVPNGDDLTARFDW